MSEPTIGKLVVCRLCQCMRLHSLAPHALHWAERDGRHVLVDCKQNEVRS